MSSPVMVLVLGSPFEGKSHGLQAPAAEHLRSRRAASQSSGSEGRRSKGTWAALTHSSIDVISYYLECGSEKPSRDERNQGDV